MIAQLFGCWRANTWRGFDRRKVRSRNVRDVKPGPHRRATPRHVVSPACGAAEGRLLPHDDHDLRDYSLGRQRIAAYPPRSYTRYGLIPTAPGRSASILRTSHIEPHPLKMLVSARQHQHWSYCVNVLPLSAVSASIGWLAIFFCGILLAIYHQYGWPQCIRMYIRLLCDKPSGRDRQSTICLSITLDVRNV